MKTITKTFYVDKRSIENLKQISGWNIYIQTEKNVIRNHPIQISWSEPEKKIEITESELDEVINSTGLTNLICKSIKQKLFGNREGWNE